MPKGYVSPKAPPIELRESFNVFVSEPLPEIDFGLKLIKDAKIRVKRLFASQVSSEDVRDNDQSWQVYL